MSETLFQEIIAAVFIVPAAVVIARNVYGKRHWLAWRIGQVAVFVLAYLALSVGLAMLLKPYGLYRWWTQEVALVLAVSVVCVEWTRSRWIPAAKRRKAVARWEARTGKHFDPDAYELDHIIPFAKGGWHTLDNLRVIRKKANRAKAHKEPDFGDWLRIWRLKDEE
jgi:hypothetical protein